MPTVNINTGNAIRFENSGELLIYNTAGSQDYSIKGIHAGSVQWTAKPRERAPEMDRADYTGIVIPGDQQINEISVDIFFRIAGVTGSPDFWSLLDPAVASGAIPTFKVVCKQPATYGGTTGVLVPFLKCYLASEGFDYQAAGRGTDFDHLRCKLIDIGGKPVPATY